MPSSQLLNISEAVKKLQEGKIIAYPTEAVYGLGCDPFNEKAVRTLLDLKGRPESAGFVLIASNLEQLKPWFADIDAQLQQQAMQRWPGPVTWLFPRAEHVPDYVAGNHKTIALRMTAHPASSALCEAFGCALISSSANLSSAAPARSHAEVVNYFANRIAGTLEGPLGDGKRPSEIRNLASGAILRQG
jgi:L-threonylcarbamoyladenylate synthase